MAGLLSSVSPVFASHLSSTGSTVQSVSAGVVSANVAHGRVGVANGDRSCGVDQVVSRGLSRSSKKVSAEEQYKKLTKNQLSDGSGGYSFESSCGADASVNALTSASARSSIDVDGTTNDWFLEENNTINWSVNTRSVNTTGARFAGGQMRGVSSFTLCPSARDDGDIVCIGPNANAGWNNRKGVALGKDAISPERAIRGQLLGYNPMTNEWSTNSSGAWKATYDPVSFGTEDGRVTRQITGVAAGRLDTDAANVAQLKALRDWVQREGFDWEISVQGNRWKVSAGQTVHFREGKNINISSGEKGGSPVLNFGLADNVELKSIEIVDGPKIDGNGIDAKNKKITNLAEGKITAESTDAVSGKQLFEVRQKIEKFDSTITSVREDIEKLSKGVNLALGGDADVEKSQQPKYTIQTKPYTGVENAFKGVDSKLTELAGKISVSVDPDGAYISHDSSNNKLSIGKDYLGTEVSIANKDKQARKLTGLKGGEIKEGSTEAITGAQLHGVDKAVKELTSTAQKAENDISKMAKNIDESLGGDSNILGEKRPVYSIQGVRLIGVGSAFINVNNALTELNRKVDDAVSELNKSLVAQEKGTNIITIGEGVVGDKISILNKDKNPRKLSGLKDGEVKESSKDAVTGNQLFELGSNISQYLGGGADVLKGTKPKYEIQTKSYDNVGAAFVGVDGTLTELDRKIKSAESSLIVHQEKDSHKITIGAKVEGGEISIANKTGGLRKLTGLEKGAVDAGSKDAVTGAQLNEVKEKFEPLNATVEKAENDVSTLNTKLNEFLGGEADVLGGKAPTYNIDSQKYTGVEDAFKGVDSKLTELSGKISTVEKNDLVKQEVSNIITIGGSVEGGEISIAGSAGLRKLTNLEDGQVNTDSTDAVTGKQLHKVQEKLDPLNVIVKKAESDVSTLVESLNKSLGGDADVLKGEQPKYEIQSESRTGVAAAFKGVDETLTDLSKQVAGVTEAMGNSLVAQDDSKITIGAKVEGGEISIASSQGLRKLTGLEEGTVDEGSTDAVSGKQLYKVEQNVKELTSTVEQAGSDVSKLATNLDLSLGGNSNVLEGTAPKYNIQKQDRTGVEDAFKGVDETLTKLSEQVESVTGVVTNSLVAQDDLNVITIGAKAEGDKISIVNSSKDPRTLTGLKDGKVDAGSTDAVTGNQLHKVDEDV
ncbi:autotransporter adhesin, partial [Bartonella chomelii]